MTVVRLILVDQRYIQDTNQAEGYYAGLASDGGSLDWWQWGWQDVDSTGGQKKISTPRAAQLYDEVSTECFLGRKSLSSNTVTCLSSVLSVLVAGALPICKWRQQI